MTARYDPGPPPVGPEPKSVDRPIRPAVQLGQHDRLEVVGLALEPDALVQGDRRGVEVVDVQRQVGVAVEGEVAAGGHGGGADAAAAELGGDVDALDLGGVVAGAADVHLELELAGLLVDVGPAAGDEYADLARGRVAGADEGPQQLDRDPLADHHAGRVEAAGGGGQGLAGGLVVGRGDQVGADVEHAPKVAG